MFKYRHLLTVALYLAVAASAPQDSSDITYVKIHPVTDEPAPAVPLTDSRIEDLQNDSKTNSNDIKEADLKEESSDDVTINYDTETSTAAALSDESTQETQEYERQTKAPSPRFLSKLSYFQKPDVGSSIATNLLERGGKRKFKSKCRCEKIWNCPKLQITVPRCPNEYFLCCF